MVPDDEPPPDDEPDELDPQAAVTAASAIAAAPTQTRDFGTKRKLTVPFVSFYASQGLRARNGSTTDIAAWIRVPRTLPRYNSRGADATNLAINSGQAVVCHGHNAESSWESGEGGWSAAERGGTPGLSTGVSVDDEGDSGGGGGVVPVGRGIVQQLGRHA